MTTIKQGIRTASGTRDLMREMTVLEQMSTNMVASPIAIPLRAEVVVASVGHIPRRRAKVGFSVVMPLRMMSSGFIDRVGSREVT